LVSEKSENHLKLKMADIEKDIQTTNTTILRLKNEIDFTKTTFNTDLGAETTHKHECEIQEIAHLEQAIADREQHRLDDLLAIQTQLDDSIRTLEDLEYTHTTKIASLQSKLKEMDERHDLSIQALVKSRRSANHALKQRVKEAESKWEKAQRLLKKLEHKHLFELTSLELETKQMHREYSESLALIKSLNWERSHVKVKETEGKEAIRVRRELEEREKALKMARELNTDLKREIGRTIHENGVARRRAALRLPYPVN
jgi:hypothetical protein